MNSRRRAENIEAITSVSFLPKMLEISESKKLEQRGGFRPCLDLPQRAIASLKWPFGDLWAVVHIGIAVASWLFLTPDLSKIERFSVDWVALLFVRNLILVVAFTSAFYVPMYVRRMQGVTFKYNSRWPSVGDPAFLFHSQLWDNVFWSLCSAVPIWTAYEAITFWLHMHGIAPSISWQQHPIYCIVLMLLTPIWMGIHFYIIHRLLHWPPLYKSVHYIHHKSTNIGPWSGLAMHPLEHILYFSAVALFWFIPAHPFHGFFILQFLALGPTVGHNGFDRIMLGNKTSLNANHYLHYLHHKYLKVNFSHPLLDRWFGTFFDGSTEARDSLKKQKHRA